LKHDELMLARLHVLDSLAEFAELVVWLHFLLHSLFLCLLRDLCLTLIAVMLVVAIVMVIAISILVDADDGYHMIFALCCCSGCGGPGSRPIALHN
jgi:hypothetical protein